MKKMILALSMMASMSLVACSHGHHCNHSKETCKMEKEGGCAEKMKGGCPDCAGKDAKAEDKKEETKK